MNMCLNEVTRINKTLLLLTILSKDALSLKKLFFPDCDHLYYYWNPQNYSSLGYSLLVALNNDTCVKYSMATQAYKVVNIHAHEISIWTIISILIHAHAPQIGGTNSDVQSNLPTLEFKSGE